MTAAMQDEMARGRGRTHCSVCRGTGHNKTTCRRPHRLEHAIWVDVTARLKVFCNGVDGRYIKSLSFGAGFHVHHISDMVVFIKHRGD